jgi:hypothetical protein
VQIVGASAPSLRIDNDESAPTKRVGLGIATALNNFIQGAVDRDFCIFNGSTSPSGSAMLFGIYNAGLTNVQEAARFSAARNFLVGTTTDAGFKTDINGSLRAVGITSLVPDENTSLNLRNTTNSSSLLSVVSGTYFRTFFGAQSATGVFYANPQVTTQGGFAFPTSIGLVTSAAGINTAIGTTNTSGGGVYYYASANGATSFHRWHFNGSEIMRLEATNLMVGTTTNAGFRLDVNGTARVQGITTISTAGASTSIILGNSSPNAERVINAQGYVGNRAAYRFNNINGGTLEACANNLTYANSWDCGSQGNIGLILTGATGTAAAGSSVLDMRSTTQGFLPPRMTTAQKNAIPSPATGLVLYDTTLNKLCVFTGVNWETVTSV